MKISTLKKLPILLSLCAGLISTSAFARDDVQDYSFNDAMDKPAARTKLAGNIKFYFGDQDPGKIDKTLGEFDTNKKTNAFNKSDKEAWQWVFLSAMITLIQRAEKEGGNAVINIKSNYKGNLTSSNDNFKCGAGSIIAGVALTGTVVRLAE